MNQRHLSHQLILKTLDHFNTKYLKQHNILFGGGTRIALELNEFRESIDIDFLCPDKESFRAVRQQVEENSLGKLLDNDFSFIKLRTDRDAVRSLIRVDGIVIKLEFVLFSDYQLQVDQNFPFVVPAIDHSSCFLTKLLANADRYNNAPYKDIFDILAMTDHWGSVPHEVWKHADQHYGLKTVVYGLDRSCHDILENKSKYIEIAENQLKINLDYANKLLSDTVLNLLEQVDLKKELMISQDRNLSYKPRL